MTWWAEVRPGVRRTAAPLLVPLEDLQNWTGFRSVYAYDDVTADRIKTLGSTAGLRGCELFAQDVLIDFDNQPEAAERCIAHLQEAGIRFTQWHSGNRSVHLHISAEPHHGSWLPVAHRRWVQKLPGGEHADCSFYSTSGQYRLPGTVHHKTGQIKRLVQEYDGMPLVLSPPSLERRAAVITATGSPEEFRALLLMECGEGQRSPHLWRLATTGLEAGMDEDEVRRWMEWWNVHRASPAQSLEKVHSQFESAQKRLEGLPT